MVAVNCLKPPPPWVWARLLVVPSPALPTKPRERCSMSRSQPFPLRGAHRRFRFAAFTASVETMPRMHARWDPTRPASHPSFSEAHRRDPERGAGYRGRSSLPPLTKNYHYEVELVAALHRGGRNVPVDRALDLVFGYALGLDMTRRDLQRAMGDEKKPWEIGKSFDRSAPIGPIHPVTQTGHFRQGTIRLKVNGKIRQNANLNQMIWNVAEQVSRLSQAFELFPGDIIYSGTPENVGPVVRGDVIDCHIDGLPDLSVRIV